jgi:hypothetical protein
VTFTCLCHGFGTGKVCARLNCKREPRFKITATHSYVLCAECWDEVVRLNLVDSDTGLGKVMGDNGTAGQA